MNAIENNIAAEVASVRNDAGFWKRNDHAFIRFGGTDVATWLQTQTSNDVLALASGQGHANALLDRKGKLQSYFTVHRWEDEFWIIVERKQAAHLMKEFDAHIILEDVRMSDAGDEVEQVVVQGPRTLALLASMLDTAETTASDYLPREWYGCHPIELAGLQVLAFRLSLTGEDGYVFVVQAGEAKSLLDALARAGESFGLRDIGPEAQEVLRIEAGIPRFGIDMDSSNRIPETTLERTSVSYTKGCYLGQEVVAKLRAYSTVKTALVGLVFDADADTPAPGTQLFIEGVEVGEARSAVFSPTMKSPIALAYLDRDRRTPDATLSFSAGELGSTFLARVIVLPFVFVPTREERARALYEKALTLFEQDTHDEDDTAITLLREAVLQHPTFEDAYEALGVILNRHHRVDEAIHYMRILARMNPDCIMAHTNLSVFYVAKGLIDEAEEEKAKAAVLQIRHARDSTRAEEMAAEERERIRNEALERIGMFEQVLEIDAEDPLATFGMGMAYLQLQEYAKAIPFLERATRTQKDYSVAYLNLGKCHEFLGELDAASSAYRAGAEAASRKGDLMPLREMQRRLKGIEESTDRQVSHPQPIPTP